jgi:hypothetical protein
LYIRESYQHLSGFSLLVIGCHTYYWEVAGFILLFWMFMPQQRIKLMMRKTVSLRNWKVYLIHSLCTIWKGYEEISMPK